MLAKGNNPAYRCVNNRQDFLCVECVPLPTLCSDQQRIIHIISIGLQCVHGYSYTIRIV